MATNENSLQRRVTLTGNNAAAMGASLCRPDLIAAYPITPQSEVVERLADMVNDGKLNSSLVQVESEHSAMSVVQGAAAGGGRTFTATSAQGLALMFEPYMRMSTLRFPMVMAIASREMTSPETIWCGHQDAITVRDAGWIQMYCENNQEILDMMIQAYRLAEDKDVLLPVNVCYDGFYLSHMVEGVYVPTQEQVDAFLPAPKIDHAVLDPENPFALDPMTPGSLLMKYRKSHLEAMQTALEKIEEVDSEFGKHFGRSYGGAIEEYRCEDAETVLVTMGAMSGTGKDAVDLAREKGIKAGLIRIRFFRPFPEKKIKDALKGKKAFAVVDRNVSFGWNCGAMFVETLAAVSDSAKNYSCFPVIGGLGGADISLKHLSGCISRLEEIKDEPGRHAALWLED